jgi:hypothetical protein
MRDWKLLVDKARALVGEDGVALLGGHSQGTTWASIFAAYDFDPTGGVRPAGCSSTAPPADATEYLAEIAALETPGGPDVFLQDLSINGVPAISMTNLGTVGQVASIAGVFDPDAPAMIQRTPIFGGGLLALIFFAPATNQTIAGHFLDDDFSDDADNAPFGDVYAAQPGAGMPPAPRTWKDFDDPTLPSTTWVARTFPTWGRVVPSTRIRAWAATRATAR